MHLTTPRCVQDACAEQIVLRALGERGKEMAKQEEDPAVLERPAARGRDPGCSEKHNLHLGFRGPGGLVGEDGGVSLPLCPGLGLYGEFSNHRALDRPITRSPGPPW